jgi:hypothetical protein
MLSVVSNLVFMFRMFHNLNFPLFKNGNSNLIFLRIHLVNHKWWLFLIWKIYSYHYWMVFFVYHKIHVELSIGNSKNFILKVNLNHWSLLEQIPQTFANTQETETILAPVIQSGIQALKVKFIWFSKFNLIKYHREPIVRVKSMSFLQHYR